MNEADSAYQATVDSLADEVLNSTVENFLKFEPFKMTSLPKVILGKPCSILAWALDRGDNTRHLGFIAERRVCLIFYRKYISRVKLVDGKLCKLTNEEIFIYD